MSNLVSTFRAGTLKKMGENVHEVISLRDFVLQKLPNAPQCAEKSSAPYVMFGKWTGRNMSNFVSSNLLCVEIDKMKDLGMEGVFQSFCSRNFTAVKSSFSENGLHFILSFPKNDEQNFLENWIFAQKLLRFEFGREIDTQCKNLNRVWFYHNSALKFYETDHITYHEKDVKFFNLFFNIYSKNRQRKKSLFAALKTFAKNHDDVKYFVARCNEIFPRFFADIKWRLDESEFKIEAYGDAETEISTSALVAKAEDWGFGELPPQPIEPPVQLKKSSKNKKKSEKGDFAATMSAIAEWNIKFCVWKNKPVFQKNGVRYGREDVYLDIHRNGIKGGKQILDDYIFSSEIEKVDVIIDFFKTKEVGKSEILKLKEKLQVSSFEFKMFMKVCREWIQFLHTGGFVKQVPILISREQNVGKTTLIRQMFSPFNLFLVETSALDPKSKDDQLKFVTNAVYFLDEITPNTGNAVKQILSSEYFEIRRHFGKEFAEYKRRCLVVATANEFSLAEKAVRFIPIQVQKIDFDIEIDWELFWRQLANCRYEKITKSELQEILESQIVVSSLEKELVLSLKESEEKTTARALYHQLKIIAPELNANKFFKVLAENRQSRIIEGVRFYNLKVA